MLSGEPLDLKVGDIISGGLKWNCTKDGLPSAILERVLSLKNITQSGYQVEVSKVDLSEIFDELFLTVNASKPNTISVQPNITETPVKKVQNFQESKLAFISCS